MTAADPRRARRFSLPDLTDRGAEAKIDAFINAPERPRGRPAAGAPGTAGAAPFAFLITRPDWTAALGRESARVERYRRPAAVVVVVATPTSPDGDGWLPRVAGPMAHAIRRGSRATDLATRTTTAAFQILLPETTEHQAARFAARIVADCDVWLHAVGAPVRVRAVAAGSTPEASLEDALGRALSEVERA